MTKTNKTVKLISIALAVLFCILLLQGLLLGLYHLRSCILLLQEPSQETTITVNGITQNSLSIYSKEGIAISRQQLLLENLLALLVCFGRTPIFCYGIHLLRKILASISQQRPFSGTASLLKKLGWASVALTAVQNLFEYALIYHYESIDISRLFVGSPITEVHFRYVPDFTYLVLAAVLFILCAIFRYGEELQQLSDETL
ncbi:MAG: hypothetical protein IJB59_10985 [Oscillospiraceae bacterium]|nr:hypothetical protein [Oscillospiraceae bacterium]